MELNGVEGKFEEFKPGDKIVSTTVYKHGRIKKWKGVVADEYPSNEAQVRRVQKSWTEENQLSNYCYVQINFIIIIIIISIMIFSDGKILDEHSPTQSDPVDDVATVGETSKIPKGSLQAQAFNFIDTSKPQVVLPTFSSDINKGSLSSNNENTHEGTWCVCVYV